MTPATLHIISLAQTPQQPWRNGGGATQELLAWPTAADWQCRVSVARIACSGPFSAFPGVERWITVISGEGVVLRMGHQRALLTVGSEPLRFEGAAAPQCDLLGGPTQDLNLMLKADRGSGAMRAAQAGEHWHSDAPLRAVFAGDATTLLVDDQQLLNLPAGTLAWCAQAARQNWQVKAPSPLSTPAPRAWWLHFKPLRS